MSNYQINQSYNFQAIMWDAWRIAKQAAKNFGGSSVNFLSIAMKQAWAKAKARALNTHVGSATPKHLFYICIDKKTGRNTKLINQPLIDQAYSSKNQAEEALDLLRQVFNQPFLKTSQYFNLHG